VPEAVVASVMAVSDDGKVEEAKASVDEPQPSVALERKPTRLTCERPEFLLIGDSITQQGFGPDGCWGALLANEWTRCADVVNRGFSGYNTRWYGDHFAALCEDAEVLTRPVAFVQGAASSGASVEGTHP